MQCPKCKLENPDSAQRCDCGYDFLAKTVKESYLTRQRKRTAPQPSDEVRAKGQRDMVLGAAVFAVGLLVTVATYGYASRKGGGQYVVAYGAIVLGIIWFIRGIDRSRSGIERAFWGKRD